MRLVAWAVVLGVLLVILLGDAYQRAHLMVLDRELMELHQAVRK